MAKRMEFTRKNVKRPFCCTVFILQGVLHIFVLYRLFVYEQVGKIKIKVMIENIYLVQLLVSIFSLF